MIGADAAADDDENNDGENDGDDQDDYHQCHFITNHHWLVHSNKVYLGRNARDMRWRATVSPASGFFNDQKSI